MQKNIEKTNALKAKFIVENFTQKHLTLAGAESCTGGAVASAIVGISGASAIFKGSAVCYCDEAKNKILGVKKSTLKKHFAESAQCVQEMAIGALKKYNANVAYATSGFLDNNTSAQQQNLARTVFVAVAKLTKNTIKIKSAQISFEKSQRNKNRMQCVETILDMLANI